METKKTPASKVLSDKWFVRVDGEESFLRQQCGVLSQWVATVSLHAVYHTGSRKENPHVHFIHSYDKLIQKQSYDIKIKNLFGVAGTMYSTKPWDGELNGAGSYLYHEDDTDNPSPVLASKGFEEIHVEAMKAYALQWRAIVVEKKQKASQTLVMRALEHFEDHDSKSHGTNARDIWNFMYHLVRNDEAYNPGEHIMKKYVVEVLAKRGSQSAWNQYVSQAFERAFPEPYEARF